LHEGKSEGQLYKTSVTNLLCCTSQLKLIKAVAESGRSRNCKNRRADKLQVLINTNTGKPGFVVN